MRRIGPVSLLAAVLTAACGSPNGPTPPPVGPRVSCPVDQTVRTTARSVSVSYPMPTATGGTAPVTIACTPPSGATFPAGRSTTTCTATDARQQTDTCTFGVIVEVVPLLSATRFLAFGDSITEGILPSTELTPIPYPAGLKMRLAARYTMQDFAVANAGVGGEDTVRGVVRLPGVLTATNPEVLLLFEGVNDLSQGDPSRIPVVIANLRTMIQTARARGVQVFLATLLPEIPGGSRTGPLPLIVPINDQIRALAVSQGVPLVDLYQAFNGMERILIGTDGLHPNAAGYEKLADTFFDAIRARFEIVPTFTSLFQSPSPLVPWSPSPVRTTYR